MSIKWNKVIWYSQVLAIVVFIMVFCGGFFIGIYYEQYLIERNLISKERAGAGVEKITQFKANQEMSKLPSSNDEVYVAIQKAVANGTAIVSIRDFTAELLPVADFAAPEIGLAFRLPAGEKNETDIFFVFIYQPSSNHDVLNLDSGAVPWAGAVVSIDGGATWSRYYDIKNLVDADGLDVRLNIEGIFAEQGLVFLDIADDRGAGSGEGHIRRLSSSNGGKTWAKDDCYYFLPEQYFAASIKDGPWDHLTPHNLEPNQNCIF